MSRGKVVMGQLPPEASLKGGLNETVSEAERNPVDLPVSEGPKQTAQGAYLPAAYKVSSGVRTDR